MKQFKMFFLISAIMISGNVFAGSTEAAAEIPADFPDAVSKKIQGVTDMLDPVIQNFAIYEKNTDAQWNAKEVKKLKKDIGTIKNVLGLD